MLTNILCILITAWQNASLRSRDGVGMNRGCSVKCFEQSQGLDTALCKNIPFHDCTNYVFQQLFITTTNVIRSQLLY